MKNRQDELIWQERIHIGDEPGVNGDASYSGLCAELLVTIRPFPGGSGEDITFILEAEDVHVFSGYAGHAVSIIGYELDSSREWKQARNQVSQPQGPQIHPSSTASRHDGARRPFTTILCGLAIAQVEDAPRGFMI